MSILCRWTMLVPAVTTHMCLGAPYGWSAISSQLTRWGEVIRAVNEHSRSSQCPVPLVESAYYGWFGQLKIFVSVFQIHVYCVM